MVMSHSDFEITLSTKHDSIPNKPKIEYILEIAMNILNQHCYFKVISVNCMLIKVYSTLFGRYLSFKNH